MNKKVLGIVGLAAVAVVGGTFAYFNQTSTVENPFDTAKYGSLVTEAFKPEDGNDWKPGVEVNKDVAVTNTGDQDVVVRIKFEDIWTGAEKDKNEEGEAYVMALTPKNSLIMGQTGETAGLTDGLVMGDQSVVKKTFNNLTNWTLADDGWYYYNTKLAAGLSTDKFLDSVQLDPLADMGAYAVKQYYTTEKDAPATTGDNWEDGWLVWDLNTPMPEAAQHTAVLKELIPDHKGYSDADYVLKITTQTVQATDKAVAAIFNTAPTNVVEAWGLETENTQIGK